MKSITLLATLLAICSVSSIRAETVVVKGTHLCCDGCRASVDAALAEVKGVSEISCDLNTKVIRFDTDNNSAAISGIQHLAKAGFFGAASLGNRKLSFPESGAKKGMRNNSILLTGLHLCCTSCVTSAQKALTDLNGVSLIDIDRSDKTIRLTGNSINVVNAITALNKAGYYCRVKKKSS